MRNVAGTISNIGTHKHIKVHFVPGYIRARPDTSTSTPDERKDRDFTRSQGWELHAAYIIAYRGLLLPSLFESSDPTTLWTRPILYDIYLQCAALASTYSPALKLKFTPAEVYAGLLYSGTAADAARLTSATLKKSGNGTARAREI